MLRHFCIAILIAWCLSTLLSYLPWLEPNRIQLDMILSGPTLGQWLGHDDLGRPIMARLIIGARNSLIVALAVVSLSLTIGTLIGMLAAWLGGWWDKCIVIVIDVFMAFPGLLLAIALAAMLGPGLANTILALTIGGWVGFARLARAQTLQIKQGDHIQAAIAAGTTDDRILRRHILPLLATPIIIQTSFEIAGAVIAESTLSFLGLGLQAPHASWGNMIRDGVNYLLIAPHTVIAPGMAVFMIVLSLNYLGDCLRDRLDVRLK